MLYKRLPLLVLIGTLVSTSYANEANTDDTKVESDKDIENLEEVKPSLPIWKPLDKKLDADFFEQFDESWEKRWIMSKSKKDIPEESKDSKDILQYSGIWKVEEPIKYKVTEHDKGLVLKLAAHHHAISTLFKNPIQVIQDGKPFVVQYEVKLQDGLQCGGAYLKLLTANKDLNPVKFNDKTPYTIMFGPDRCGNEGKVHFILRHKNPLNGTISEKHLVSPPAPKSTTSLTTLYTLVIRPDNTYEVKINNQMTKKGSLNSDFEPAINPPKEIVDVNDFKPEDWEDNDKISDPADKKPEGWVEEATIPDPSKSKPADWLKDEPLYVADLTAKIPEDWNEEEDGDWIAPEIPNPKCNEVSGCGEWKHPHIPNPAYKGVWQPKLIDNPKYKGVWEPRKVANPEYYLDSDPAANLSSIGGLGFELWTMQSDILFDNIYVGHSEEEADEVAKLSWELKFKAEEELKDSLLKQDTPEEVESTFTTYLNLLTNYATEFAQRTHLDYYFELIALKFHQVLILHGLDNIVDIIRYNLGLLIDLIQQGELWNAISSNLQEFYRIIRKEGPYESLNQMPYTAAGLFIAFVLVWAVFAKLLEFVFPPPALYEDMEARNKLAAGHNPYERKVKKSEILAATAETSSSKSNENSEN